MSDTHGLHHSLRLEGGTVLIHAGDITEYGTEEEVVDFLNWFSKQPYTYKIFVAGNHDLFMEESTLSQRRKILPKGVMYLQDTSIEIENIKMWGSPVTPYFLGMAFNVRRGTAIEKIWNKIPMETQLLITHSPPMGILDNGIGCEDLLNRVNIVKPKIHVFGHAHGRNGMQIKNGIRFINAGMLANVDMLKNEEHIVDGKPIVLKL